MFASIVYRNSPFWMQEGLISWRSRARNMLREGRRFRGWLREVRATQWLSREELLDLQQETLVQLLRHAGDRVPFYHETFATLGIDPRAGTSALAQIPFLDKRRVLQQGDRMVASGWGKPRIPISTSGSTGSPLRILQNLSAVIRENAFLWRQLEWAGFTRGERRAWIRGDMVVPIEQARPPYWRFNRADNMMMMSSYHLSKNSALFYLEQLEAFDPVTIQAYPSSIAYVARFLAAEGRRYGAGSLRSIVTSSETLTDSDRMLIEDRFGCRVYDQYGNGERVALIQTCEEGARHLALDYSIVELEPLADNLYEMVGTGFNNWVMPFIRYRTGDTVELDASHCVCGRQFPVIKSIGGRLDDYIKTADGRRIGRLDHIFKGVSHIAEGQVIQERLDRVVIKVVPFGAFGEADKWRLVANARARVGAGAAIVVQVVSEIPRARNGKFRAVVCHV